MSLFESGRKLQIGFVSEMRNWAKLHSEAKYLGKIPLKTENLDLVNKYIDLVFFGTSAFSSD